MMAAAVAGDLGWNEIPLALRLVKTCQIARGCGTLCTPPSAVFHSAFIGGHPLPEKQALGYRENRTDTFPNPAESTFQWEEADDKRKTDVR